MWLPGNAREAAWNSFTVTYMNLAVITISTLHKLFFYFENLLFRLGFFTTFFSSLELFGWPLVKLWEKLFFLAYHLMYIDSFSLSNFYVFYPFRGFFFQINVFNAVLLSSKKSKLLNQSNFVRKLQNTALLITNFRVPGYLLYKLITEARQRDANKLRLWTKFKDNHFSHFLIYIMKRNQKWIASLWRYSPKEKPNYNLFIHGDN